VKQMSSAGDRDAQYSLGYVFMRSEAAGYTSPTINVGSLCTYTIPVAHKNPDAWSTE
jgi:hypothetical protein